LISKKSSHLKPLDQMNQKQTPSDGKSSHCLWQGELKTIVYSFSAFKKDRNPDLLPNNIINGILPVYHSFE
jgi:hypothetical protein